MAGGFCIFTKKFFLTNTDDAEMGNVKLSITTAAMIFDVWCCFWMNRLFCFDVFNYKEVYGPLPGCLCVCGCVCVCACARVCEREIGGSGGALAVHCLIFSVAV